MKPVHFRSNAGWTRRGWLAAMGALVLAGRAGAQELSAFARLARPLRLRAVGRGVSLELNLTQPVPFRLRHRADPPRLLLDFRRVDWTGFQPPPSLPPGLVALRVGEAGGGWSRLVLELARPLGAEQLGMRVDPESGGAQLALHLDPVSEATFASRVAADAARFNEVSRETALEAGPARAPLGQRPAVVVLDPGHGGIDPGAERGGLRESDLMLAFGQELAAQLRQSGGYEVVLTRETDAFVSLEARIRIARRAGADLFISLHADALAEGGASGATVYTLSDDASDAAAAALAERHDRADLLGGGVDLSGTDDGVAGVLMAIARAETQPRTERLAGALIGAIQAEGLATHRRPHQHAAFSVLKAPDIPSVLLEVGFMSSARDLANLQSAEWRMRMVAALEQGLADWVAQEVARASSLRR